MKKIGLIIFATAIIVGVVIANLFSWGKATGEVFNFDFKIGKEKGSGRMATDPLYEARKAVRALLDD